MQRFILLSTIRSGTNFFNSVLNSHPDIHMYSETLFYDFDFNPNRTENFYVNWLKRVQEDPAQILNRNMVKYAYQFIDEKYAAMEHLSAAGMDIKYNFWDRLLFIQQYFLSRKPKVVHLVRLNTLRQHIWPSCSIAAPSRSTAARPSRPNIKA